MRKTISLDNFLTEYCIRNEGNRYRPVAVGRKGIRLRESIYSKELAKDYSKNKVIHKNTLTVGMGSVQIDIGILSTEETYSVSPAYRTYRIQNISPDYLRYCLEHRNLDMFARYVKRGTRQGKTIDHKAWLKYKIPVYDEVSQAEIVRILDKVTQLADKRRQQLILLEDLIKSRFIEMFGDPVSNTQGRKVRPFKDFMSDIRYGTSQPPVFSADGVFKFIRATNIKTGRITEKDMLRISAEETSKLEKCRLNGNEIIIVRSGANTGDTCVVTEEYRNQYAGYDIIITLDLEIANPVFFNELMNTHYMQDVIKPLTFRAAQPHINSEQVQNLPMLVVPLSEQEQFAAFVAQVDKSKFCFEKQVDLAKIIIEKVLECLSGGQSLGALSEVSRGDNARLTQGNFH